MKIIFFSGAGLSAESGLSTFRDSDGLWANYDINEVCNYDNWEQNFDLVHEFYSKRRQELATVKPNNAHIKIAQMQQKYGEAVQIITQNVDNLLEQAGCTDVIHVHGELTKLRCLYCNHVWDVDYKPYGGESCPKCKHTLIKPFVVFFYEPAPLYRSMFGLFQTLDSDDIIVSIGTSGNVISFDMLLRGVKGYKILNNLEPSLAIDEALFDEIIYEKATSGIEKIATIIGERMGD